MGTFTWLLLGVALGIATPFVILGYQRRHDVVRAGTVPAHLSRAEAMRPANPFAAVSIRPSAEKPCAAVVQMHHLRYLAVRAPSLPVAGCDRKQCGCRFVRHSDRRATGDRRDGFARFGGLIPTVGKDRRAPDDRRGGK